MDWIIAPGWSPTISWSQFDLLIHPALQEPFGMVVAEARSQGLPVLMSSNVGASDLKFSNTKRLSLTDSVSRWCDAAKELVEMDKSAQIKWSWDDLVNKHLTMIYPKISPIKL